ncbi:PHA/PHB synthase family protein [Pseudonocardia sp. CA-107938]|uniref:PHA/PHB synthase family protein n=1 Tax=Pseudonocardia sp. CA-107938 TaxID=3240021 RepID=UPI003D915944
MTADPTTRPTLFPRAAREAAEQAVAALGPEADVLGRTDPADLGASLFRALARSAGHPVEVAAAVLKFMAVLSRIAPAAMARAVGHGAAAPPLPEDPKDRRFADPAWTGNAGFFALRQVYLAVAELCADLVAAGTTDPAAEAKARLVMDLLVDAIAPTNFFPTNPAALVRAMQTGGRSTASGLRNFVSDVVHNGGRPRQVDVSGFEVGRNLAATPGKVVYRNDLMELLQYAPQTPQVHAVPLLASPPWINKYYVMDLAPERSFVEWAVRHGRTVFAISYRNPDAAMRDVGLDDYLIHGPRTALDVITDITGSERVDVVGLCLGGAMTAMTAAHLVETGEQRIGTITLLNTLLDYSEPGVLGAFTDERVVARMERRMARTGYLDGAEMAATFDILRPNDLIFNYVVSNWLLGERPPAFDILAWNSDSTRMPAAMHAFYLRSLYGRNELARGELTLAGTRLDLGDVTNDAYVVGAVNDHIVPWTSSYQATKLLGGHVRYVLSSGGHIAGIVNPPHPKAWYETAEDRSADPARWRAAASRQAGSWWEDWAVWGAQRAGALIDPPPMGSPLHPVLGDAPGSYVTQA